MEFVGLSIQTHIYTIYALIVVIFINFYNVLKTKEFIPLVKKLKFTTPLYHMINAMVAYSGGIVAAYSHDLSLAVILMIATAIFIMVLEIKRYKKMRVIKVNETEKQQEFITYVKKIYILELSAIVITYIVAKVW